MPVQLIVGAKGIAKGIVERKCVRPVSATSSRCGTAVAMVAEDVL